MKKRTILKSIIIFILVIITCMLGLFVYYFLNYKSDYTANFGPVKLTNFNYDEIIDVDNGYLLVKDNDNQKIVDSNNNIFIEFENNINSLRFEEGYFFLSDEEKQYIYDVNGGKILESNGTLYYKKDEIANIIYFIETKYDEENDADINVIYNQQLNKILTYTNYEFDYSFEIIDDKIYAGYNIYDLNSNKIGEYEDIYYFDKNLIVNIKNNVLLIDLNNRKIDLYDRVEYDYNGSVALYKNDDVIYMDYYGHFSKVKPSDVLNLENGYFIDYTSCDIGGILKNKENNVIFNDCSSDYDISAIDKGIIIANKYSCEDMEESSNNCFDEHSTTIQFSNGKTINGSSSASIAGEYINVSKYDEKELNSVTEIYNFSGDLIGEKEYNIQYFGIDLYYTYTGDQYHLLDSKLNKIDEFDSISCDENHVCIVSQNGYSGIYFIDNWLVELGNYFKIRNNYDNSYILEGMNGYKLLVFSDTGKFIDKKTINNVSKEYLSIDEKDYIAMYNLNESIIENNLEFFKKYAFVVNNNSDITEYNDYLFKLFEVVIKNKKQLIESYLLYGLKQLNIEVGEETECGSTEEAVGCYIDSKKNIECIENLVGGEDFSNTLWHELIHFLDHNFNNFENEVFYKNDNNDYISSIEYNKLSNIDRQKYNYYGDLYTKFLTEGGAELFSAKYFNDYRTDTYFKYVNILSAFSLLFGEEKLEEIFYSGNTDYEFYKLLVLDNQMNSNDYVKLLDYLNSDNVSGSVMYTDLLIELAKKRNVNIDNKLKYIISKEINRSELSKNNKNYELYNKLFDYSFEIEWNVERHIIGDSDAANYSMTYIFINNDIKFIFSGIIGDNPHTTYLITYDFKSNKVTNVEELGHSDITS